MVCWGRQETQTHLHSKSFKTYRKDHAIQEIHRIPCTNFRPLECRSRPGTFVRILAMEQRVQDVNREKHITNPYLDNCRENFLQPSFSRSFFTVKHICSRVYIYIRLYAMSLWCHHRTRILSSAGVSIVPGRLWLRETFPTTIQ